MLTFGLLKSHKHWLNRYAKEYFKTQNDKLRYHDFIRKINQRSWTRHSVKTEEKESEKDGR